MALSDILGAILANPYGGAGMLGGPTLPMLPKAQTSATATGIPSAKIPGPYEGMTAMTNLANVASENQLRQGQLGLLEMQRPLLEQQLQILKQIPGSLDQVMGLYGGQQGQGQATPSAMPNAGTGNGGAQSQDHVPSEGSYDIPGLYSLAVQAGYEPGEKAAHAAAISMAESSGNPVAHNTNGEDSRGLMQINGHAWGPLSVFDPLQNMRNSLQISQGGTKWTDWSMFKNGEYKKYLPQALAAARSNPQLAAGPPPEPSAESGSRLPPRAGLSGNDPDAQLINLETGSPLNLGRASSTPAEQFAANAAQPTGAGTNGISPMLVAQNAAPTAAAMPPQAGALAAGGALPQIPGAQGMSPLQQAIVRLGVLSRLGKLGDVATPLEQAFYNSPQMKAQVAAAEAWAKVHPELFTKMNTPMNVRPGGGVMMPGTGQLLGAMPTLQQTADPVTGQKSFAYMAPPVGGGQTAAPSVTPTGAISALGPGQISEAEASGKNRANLGPLLGGAASSAQPQQPPGQAGEIGATDVPKVTEYGVIPPLSEQKLPQSAAELEKAIPTWQERVVDWTKGLEPARQAEQRLNTIAQAFKATQSGSWTTEKANVAAALKSVGINIPDAVLNNPADVQLALHENILTTLPLIKAATPRPSQVEFIMTSENREHPNIQPEANLKMLAEDIALMRQAQHLPSAYNASGWSNPLSFEVSYFSRNKLGPMVEAVQKEIGPLKGMGQGTLPAGAQHIGTYQGRPVYDVPQPDGTTKRQVLR